MTRASGNSPVGEREVIQRVQRVYEGLAKRPVERNCVSRAECCQFHLTGRLPLLTAGEAMVLARAWRASGRKVPQQVPVGGACPLLDQKTLRCTVYDARPFGCRTHFCRSAGGPVSRDSVIDLIRELERIDEELGGDGPHTLPQALSRALSRRWTNNLHSRR